MKKVILATVIWLVPLLGYGSETSHVARLEILFPETREGVTVADLPRATPEWRQDNRDSLRSAFLRSNHGVLVEDEGCSFITRALYDQDDLYIGDITADGIEDILYVGSALCREGDATVIWYGSESRQGRWMVARDAPRILTSRVLRIHGLTPWIGWHEAWLLRPPDHAVLLILPWQEQQGRCRQANGLSRDRVA